MQVNPKIRHALIAVALVLFASTCIAFAQGAPKNAPPSYVADPAVYKLIGENEQYVVIMAERPVGHRDVWHSHLPQQVTYMLTDCDNRIYTPDGKTTDSHLKKGSVRFGSGEPSHALENIGKAECDQLIVEHK